MYNGNNYDPQTRTQLIARGLWSIESTIEAICRFTIDKNIKLFSELKVLNPDECRSRQTIMLSQYIGVVGKHIKIIKILVPQC